MLLPGHPAWLLVATKRLHFQETKDQSYEADRKLVLHRPIEITPFIRTYAAQYTSVADRYRK
jgi:hypothetical protein